MNPLTRFHAHVYFDRAQRGQAIDLREEVGRRFALPVGAMHDRPVGPHSKGMFQILFGGEDFGHFVPWLMQHRGDLDVLVHGDTGDDYIDHTRHVLWLGTPQYLDVEKLRPVERARSAPTARSGQVRSSALGVPRAAGEAGSAGSHDRPVRAATAPGGSVR